MRTKLTRLLIGLALTIGLTGALLLLSPRLAPLQAKSQKSPATVSADDVDALVDEMNADLRRLHDKEMRRQEMLASRPGPSDRQIAIFQAEADKACLCTRRAGAAAHDRCWSNYERAVAAFKPDRMGTMCIGANYWDFFPGEKSVTLQRAGEACTPDEEQAQLAQWRREGIIEAGRAEDAGGCG